MEFVSWLREENRKNNQRSLHTIQVFDTFVERYDAWFDSPFGKSAFNLEKSCITSLCRNLKRPSLEIGVGTGRFAEALGIEYGVDISGRVLEFAKRRRITVVKGSGEKLPFPDESFGSIFIIATICFVEKPEKVLEEASRVLAKDGRLTYTRLNIKGKPVGTLLHEERRSRQRFLQKRDILQLQ